MNDKELDACDAAFADGYARGRATAAEIERAARSLMTRDDFWRNAGTLPGEYDNLKDALAGKP